MVATPPAAAAGVSSTDFPALAQVRAELEAYKRKFYLSLLVRGGLVAAALLLSLFVVLNTLEYFLYLPPVVRAGLLFGFLTLAVYAVGRWLWQPLAALANLRRLLSDEQAARQVGELFPQVQDRLLNALQLQGQARGNALLLASLEQRAAQLHGVSFAQGINIQQQSRPLWKYVLPPLAVLLLALAFFPSFITQPTSRIWHYQRRYSRPAPFAFVIKNKQLQVFKGESFTLSVAVTGKALPATLSLLTADGPERPLAPVPGHPSEFRYTFEQPAQDVAFQLSGAGFVSDEYQLTVLERPDLRDFTVRVTYPAYTGRTPQNLRNGGNLTVPEGSQLRWEFSTAATEALALRFDNPAELVQATRADDAFVAERRALRSQQYLVQLRNAASANANPISYQLTVVPDAPPSLTVEAFSDTTSMRFLALGGSATDDYGLTALRLHYRLHRAGAGLNAGGGFASRALPLPSGAGGTYAYTWNLAPLALRPGDRLEYFVEAVDNDGIHGPKSTRSRPLEFRLPSRREQDKQLASAANAVASQLSAAAKQSKQLERELAQSQDKLKTKRDLSFQDRKQLQDMLEQKQQMDQQVSQMQKQFDQLQKQQNQLDPKSEELAQKAEELKKLMSDLLDPETKKLYEKLQKLLDEQKKPDAEMQKLMQQLENKENTLQKELDRALEMFKQMQFEQKAEKTADRLDQLAKDEQKLAEKTAENDKNNPDNKQSAEQQKTENQQLQKEQAQRREELDQLKEDLKDLKQQDKEMGDQNELDEQKADQEQADQEMQDGEQQLGKNQNQKASQSQKAAAQRLEKMAKKMRDEASDDEQQKKQQNIDDLRDILDNLVTLSFDQEKLMKDFRAVDQTDPRFVQLGQTQRKLRDDAQIIQDSLYALAKRETRIQSFVTREVGEMNGRMDESLTHIKQRDVARATTTQQQAMTSVNNLALMLSDALKQMQQDMQQMQGKGPAKPGSGKGKKKGKGGSPGAGGLGKMQQQLNDQIQQLQQSGKTGRALSQELAKLAGQQQLLRQAMQQMGNMPGGGKPGGKDGKEGKDGGKNGGKPGQDKDGQGGGGNAAEMKKMMEQTETDLVNKRLTEETIQRQRQILTRLLEAEKSARERDQDTKREAQAAQNHPPVFPPAFEKYKTAAPDQQTEILRRQQPALTPYYQQKVSEYFQKNR
ncbi:DUF4175 family protein [Hymenobacter sp. H14-R3]|uniref:DUF4175 family protein n=1 Tax=Hymenobacter sp. H14-R3 TaxID=3046308 RepID=UPI0024BBE4BE|nr:DUF4175 family protein [Hymenobacter sp. H14-R3]MDJ0364471.1 DUF4175 family protein [Hymenobacter sp. H14-R3]